jgi:thymidylate kinase
MWNGERSEKRHAIIVSFSGIDGAGKSTQIDLLCKLLKQAGGRVLCLAFWEDVAVLRKHRERTSITLFKGDPGVGSPGKPVSRRDKNVRSWYLTVARLLLYLLDGIHLRFVVGRTLESRVNVIFFDRYLFDELANLPLEHRIIRHYVRLLLKLIPIPDIAYLLDSDPAAACRRKPEYPLDFLHDNRRSYLALSELIPGLRVIGPLPLSEVRQEVVKELQERVPDHKLEASFVG